MAEDITGILIETDDILGTVDDINVTGAVYEQVSLVTYVDTAVSDVLSGDFTPTSLTTSGRKFAILLTYAGTLPFGGVFEIWASDSNDRTVATHVDDSSALTYLHSGLDLVDTKYYWIRVRDMYGANSSWYPSSATAGVSGTTSTDASDYLDLLIGNISEDQLVDELKTRINLIDRDYIYEEGVFEQSDPFDPFTMVFAGIDKLVDALISDNTTNISDINDLISTTLTHAAEIAAIESEITSLTTSEWQNDQSYTVGRYVVYNDTVYRCTQAYTYPPAKEPGVDTDYWEEADSIVTLVSDVESRVDVLEGTITDKVGSTEFNALENRVTVNEAAITVNSADILLRATQSDFDAFSILVFPEYSTGDTYAVNDIVQHDGALYKCILVIDFSPAPDPSNTTYWEAVTFTHEFQTAVSQIDVNATNISLSSSAIVGDVTYLFALEADRSYETGVYVETVGDIDGLDLTITQAGIDIDGAQADILIHTSQISGLDSRLSQAEIDIDGAEAAIVLRASQSSLDATNANVTAAGIRLDGHDASISAQALQISTLESTTGTHTTQISQAQVDIDAAEAAILLRATKTEIDGTLAPEWSAVVTYTAGEQVRYYSTQYDLYKCILTSPAGTLPTNDTYWTKLGLIGGRVSQAEADIDAAEASILLKASQVDLSALTSRVSNAEIDIDGAQASILLHTSQISTLQDTTGTHTAQIAQAQIDINTAESNIADGQAGTWSSISSKATTATVNALDTRVGTVETGISGLQTQIDGKIETYYTDTDPNTWASGDRTKHTGDMWYAPTTHLLKRYDGTLNSWSTIEDQKAIDAYTNAARAQDTADGKRRVFVTTPTTPYDVGDLWSGGSSGDLKRCKTQRLTGAYQAGDWELASKYTDDSSLTTFISTYNNDQKVGGVLRISTAESNISTLQSNIADGQAGTWSSISSKATTATVSAIDIRLSTVESDISAGEAGTWASITNKLGIATYDADQKVGGVLRIGEAEEAITVLEGDNNSIKAQYTLKLNVNDRVAGFGLMLSDDEPSEFAIVADRFIIVDPDIDGNESVPFIVGDIGGVHTVGINGNLIVDGSILAQSIGANEIIANTANIKDAIITNAKINDLNATKINAGYLSADRLEALSITGDKIAANTIEAGKLSVTSLSAIAANLGTITAGKAQNSGGTNYINFDATGTNSFLKVGSNVDIKADGSGVFARSIISEPYTQATGTLSGLSLTDGTVYVRTGVTDSTSPWSATSNKSFSGRAQASSGYRSTSHNAAFWWMYIDVCQVTGFEVGTNKISGWYRNDIGLRITVQAISYLAGDQITDINWALMRV